jgi:ribokinase
LDMAEVVVVGSLHVDLMVKLDRIPMRGETVIGGFFKISPGGKGANQAVAASRLGIGVAMVGRVGADIFGEMLLERLGAENVDTGHVVRDPTVHTGVALIMVDKRGGNLIAVSSGADERCSPSDVDAALDTISQAKAVLLQLEIPQPTVEHAINSAKRMGSLVILNPAPARALPKRLLEKVDILMPNTLEASFLSGVRVHDVPSAVRAGRRLLAMGAKNVLVTLGRRGVVALTERETIHLRGVRVRAVDTTGAGDAFCGALAYGLARGMRLHEAAELANNAAALSTTKLGAQEAMPTLEELHHFMTSNGRARRLGKPLIPHS